MDSKTKRYVACERTRQGSALILVVVLTSLLAVLGVMFVMVARVDNMSTSAVTDNKDLSFAVDSVIARISKELAEDVPAFDPCVPVNSYANSEYYDYPSHTLMPGPDGPVSDQVINPGPDGIFGPPARDATADDFPNFGVDDDPWLAALEPEIIDVETVAPTGAGVMGFRHITDLYGTLAYKFHESYNPATKALDPLNVDAEGDRVSFRNLRAWIINPSTPIRMEGDKADADGDGVADSRWVKIPGLYSKGRDVYAAIRIVDNGGMLNVNTGYLFDPCEIVDPCNLLSVGPHWQRIDGSSQTQVNLAALSQRGVLNDNLRRMAAMSLHDQRCGTEPRVIPDLRRGLHVGYDPNVIWQYGRPRGTYTPFDIGDELKLRNRFILNQEQIFPRLDMVWNGGYRYPRDSSPRSILLNHKLDEDWFWLASNVDPNEYDYRHITTVYNMDRTIDPNGEKMEGVNHIRPINIVRNNDPLRDEPLLRMLRERSSDANDLYLAMVKSVMHPDVRNDSQFVEASRRFAQLAVNMVDFVDSNDYTRTIAPVARIAKGTAFRPRGTNEVFYGFEAQPFITELGWVIDAKPQSGLNYFAAELYNPSSQNLDISDFEIELHDPNSGQIVPLGLGAQILRPNRCLVVSNYLPAFSVGGSSLTIEDSEFKLMTDYRTQNKGEPVEDPRGQRPRPRPGGGTTGSSGSSQGQADKGEPGKPQIWGTVNSVYLVRRVPVYDPNSLIPLQRRIYVDRQVVDVNYIPDSGGVKRFIGRDCRSWHVVYQTMKDQSGSLGFRNAQVQMGHPYSFYMPNPLLPDNPYVNPIVDSTVTWAPDKFVTVGDIVRVLTLGNSVDPEGTIGEQIMRQMDYGEGTVRLDLRNPYFRNIFQYLTVFDPSNDGLNNDGDSIRSSGRANVDEPPEYVPEMVTMPDMTTRQWWHIYDANSQEWKVRGKININTAPWFVIAQLPWVSQRQGYPPDASLARAIVAYRDKIPLYAADGLTLIADYSAGRQAATGSSFPLREKPGFSSIAELNFVINNQTSVPGARDYRIDKYALDPNDLLTFPDLTQMRRPGQGFAQGYGLGFGDEIPDDFEERDIIFSRISNLATVRSDIFTAYILVRLGEDGPEKRMVAILDRSDVYRDRYRYKNPNNPDPAADFTGSRLFGDVKVIALHPVADAR